jgi:DNA-binding SARP family transcriptional activator
MQFSKLVLSAAAKAPDREEFRGPAASSSPLVRLLGNRRLGIGTREASLQYRKGWALLAYLAVERRRHCRTRLAGLFWPDLSESSGLTNLRQVLSDLNRSMIRAIGEGVLRIDRESVELCPLMSVGMFDVDLLDAATHPSGSAMEIDGQDWLAEAGELLEGQALEGCEEFADWLACTREWSQRRVLAGMAQLRDLASARGERRKALELGRRLVAQDPWNELHYRALMRLHAQLGEPGMALACYHSLGRRLRTDLGESPSRETTALAESIRTASRAQAAHAGWARAQAVHQPSPALLAGG